VGVESREKRELKGKKASSLEGHTHSNIQAEGSLERRMEGSSRQTCLTGAYATTQP
jgi:hypothetical protein